MMNIQQYSSTIKLAIVNPMTESLSGAGVERRWAGADESCGKLLGHALNIPWQDHPTNDSLYKDLPRISLHIKRLRLQFAGHCFRDKGQPVHRLLFWKPIGRTMKVGRGDNI